MFRILHLETVSTQDHPSPLVAAVKKAGILGTATALLKPRLERKSKIAQESPLSSAEKERSALEVKEITELLEAVRGGEDDACNRWEMEMTWIVARKAIISSDYHSWMTMKYPS